MQAEIKSTSSTQQVECNPVGALQVIQYVSVPLVLALTVFPLEFVSFPGVLFN